MVCSVYQTERPISTLALGPQNGDHFSRWGAASGCLSYSPDLPLFYGGYSLGGGSESDRLADHRDEFCRLSLP
jgi:hypothetical protein